MYLLRRTFKTFNLFELFKSYSKKAFKAFKLSNSLSLSAFNLFESFNSYQNIKYRTGYYKDLPNFINLKYKGSIDLILSNSF